MRTFPLAVLVTSVLAFVSGCEERQNPLQSVDTEHLVNWLNDRGPGVKKQMQSCGVFWAEVSGVKYPADTRADCNELAERLAAEMSAAGFGEIQRDDVVLPTLWTAYGQRQKNVYDPRKAAETIR